jgi:5-methylcytosine-specific restriction protein A
MLRPRVAVLDTALAPPPPKQADPWYGTPEHKAWAEAVIKRAGGRCQDPECRTPGLRVIADHIVEKKDGGNLTDPNNGLARCWPCHTRKTNAARAARQRGERHPGGGGQKSTP